MDKENKQEENRVQLKNQRKLDPLKSLERDFADHYERKGRRLEQNVLRFQENLKLKRLRREKSLQSGAKSVLFRSLSPNRAGIL